MFVMIDHEENDPECDVMTTTMIVRQFKLLAVLEPPSQVLPGKT